MEKNTTNDTINYYPDIRVYASGVCFIIMAFFNVIINWTIMREERLRGHARFVLIFHLLFSALVYFAVCSAFYLQIYLQLETSAAACRTVITILISSASNILLTLTAMALDRYYAVCFPLKYSSTCSWQWPWLTGLLTWGLALIIPLSLFFKLDDIDYARCDREHLRKGEIHKILLITTCLAVIIFSYIRTFQESRRLGVLNRRNSVACKTIALHGTQLAVYLLPNFVNFLLHSLERNKYLERRDKELYGVVIFAFCSLAQCIAPIVYGLRNDELLEDMHRRFPQLWCNLKSLVEWTVRTTQVRVQSQAREKAIASETLISIPPPATPV
ncbi:olfactory receptor 11A1 [Paramormyrops kingsleyae]|uniref:Zgc:194312 n=1 Tax=Paramormyrops kingsleyae TaxID=1676925 RepID=A0A3B3S013_9TELE|nr:olfactory receptor 11A1-like [Paramormyrops kingsleyae]